MEYLTLFMNELQCLNGILQLDKMVINVQLISYALIYQ